MNWAGGVTASAMPASKGSICIWAGVASCSAASTTAGASAGAGSAPPAPATHEAGSGLGIASPSGSAPPSTATREPRFGIGHCIALATCKRNGVTDVVEVCCWRCHRAAPAAMDDYEDESCSDLRVMMQMIRKCICFHTRILPESASSKSTVPKGQSSTHMV